MWAARSKFEPSGVPSGRNVGSAVQFIPTGVPSGRNVGQVINGRQTPRGENKKTAAGANRPTAELSVTNLQLPRGKTSEEVEYDGQTYLTLIEILRGFTRSDLGS